MAMKPDSARKRLSLGQGDLRATQTIGFGLDAGIHQPDTGSHHKEQQRNAQQAAFHNRPDRTFATRSRNNRRRSRISR